MNNISINTIKVYLAGVRQLHIRERHPPPATAEMAKLNQILRGIKISQATSSQPARGKQRHPITPEILRRVKSRWQQEPPSQDRVMLWAAFLTCFFGFFRSGEICGPTAVSEGLGPTTELSVDSIAIDSIRDPRSVRIHLRRSKTDPFREGASISLPRTNDDLCPVAALLSWLVHRGNSPGPLFRLQSGAPLTRPRLVIELRKVLGEVGLEAEHFSGHSFRKGAATTAAALGIPDSQIKLLGRWKSTAFQRYLHPAESHLANLAAQLSQEVLPTTQEHPPGKQRAPGRTGQQAPFS